VHADVLLLVLLVLLLALLLLLLPTAHRHNVRCHFSAVNLPTASILRLLFGSTALAAVP
jgi:hypothetical protein